MSRRSSLALFRNSSVSTKLITTVTTTVIEPNNGQSDAQIVKTLSLPDEYVRNMDRIRSEHLSLCRSLRIQQRTRSHVYQLLQKGDYFVQKETSRVSADGKRRRLQPPAPPSQPMRLTFWNGGTCHFPLNVWPDVFQARARDFENGNLMYDNEIVWSNEGIKLFFELDYRSQDKVPDEDSILAHVAVCAQVVRRFFKGDDIDFKHWVLMCTPKPKYVKNQLHPVIAMGCHIIFPHIIVTCEQGSQLCHSANIAIEAACGPGQVDVDSQYKDNGSANLRPMFCRKLEDCPECLNDEEIRLSCEVCVARGKVASGSIYTASYVFDTNGQNLYEDAKDLEAEVRANLVEVISETSIINTNQDFTKSYAVPPGEPVCIPKKLQSTHQLDQSKSYVYRQDRKRCSTRNLPEIMDPDVLSLAREAVRNFHPKYNHDNMILAKVCRNNSTIFVDLKGVGRSFCQIKHPGGQDHTTNRVFFRLCKKTKTITQHCYNDECKNLLKTDAAIKTRVTKPLNVLIYAKLFPCTKKKNKVGRPSKSTVESMTTFLDTFETPTKH